MNQEIINMLNEITEIHLSLKEFYQKLSQRKDINHQSVFSKKADDYEVMSKEMLQLIYNAGGKYIECKNPTEQELEQLVVISSDEKSDVSEEAIQAKISEFLNKLKQKYEDVLESYSFSSDQQEILKNHINRL
tara:strand:- start:30343 stop:30741 length:399 start_codon:yes stop_codon:yes gene_type:complete